MAKAKPDNYILQQRTVRNDYEPEEMVIDPAIQHLFPGYKETIGRRDFIPDADTLAEQSAGRITKLQEKYGLDAEEGKPLPKPKKAKTGYLDPRCEH